jgi:plasmid stabilization system protein ParE
MAYKVVFAPTAIARLEDIVRYIAADDPATASTFAMQTSDIKSANGRIRRGEHCRVL